MLSASISYITTAGDGYQNAQWRATFQEIVKGSYRFDECLKHDGTTTVFLSRLKHQSFVIKRYNTKNRWHFFRRFVQTSRAQNCFEMATRYLNASILTPEPVAYIQERFLFFKLRSWYICQHQEGALLSEFLKDDEPLSLSLNTNIDTLFSHLERSKFSHGDMKATNLIVDKLTRLYVIDLDAARMHHQNKTWRKAINKDWNRLLKNWPINSPAYHSLCDLKEAFFKRL